MAMADGYAQASGRPSFVNLHTVAGLGGGLGNLTNALANRTPMVVTAGQQDRRHLLAEPILSGDLTGLAAASTKWQHEVRHLGELAPVLRRAFLSAATPPTGPVFVSIPMDVLDETGDVDVPPRSHVERGAVAGGLEELAGLLAEAAPDDVALVVGDEIAAGGARRAEVVALAEALGARVYGVPLYSNLELPDRPSAVDGHARLHRGGRGRDAVPLPAHLRDRRQGLPRVPLDAAVPVAGRAASCSTWPPIPALVGRDLPTRFGTVGDIAASLAALVPLVAARVDTAAAGGRPRPGPGRSGRGGRAVRRLRRRPGGGSLRCTPWPRPTRCSRRCRPAARWSTRPSPPGSMSGCCTGRDAGLLLLHPGRRPRLGRPRRPRREAGPAGHARPVHRRRRLDHVLRPGAVDGGPREPPGRDRRGQQPAVRDPQDEPRRVGQRGGQGRQVRRHSTSTRRPSTTWAWPAPSASTPSWWRSPPTSPMLPGRPSKPAGRRCWRSRSQPP